MHRLQRGKPPEALTRQARHKKWQDLSGDEKQQVWEELERMQRNLCAYCERTLPENAKHIDHFRQRSLYPEGCFEWANLFGSCNDEHCCGKHKDKLARDYDFQNIIKPDADNPDDFLQFFADGTIAPRADLDTESRQRATETLRVMNLNAHNGKLRHMRKKAISGWLSSLETLKNQLLDSNEELVQKELADMLRETATLEFATAIQHSLQALS